MHFSLDYSISLLLFLLDFHFLSPKIIELFDRHNVSFVSVTQSFNTSNSSGKLMLNILLSFAQFERELTGERIRDKFASSLKKGIWMGGCVPLGYFVKDRKLLIDQEESEIIKFIYGKFLETESYYAVKDLLNRAGYKTKIKQLSNGKTVGGNFFEPKAVLRILKNPYYKGCVIHKGNIYLGEHEAIIDENTWNKVQEILENHRKPERKYDKNTSPSFLKGMVRCVSCGCSMKPTYAVKNGLRYRYYTCLNHIRFKSCKSEFKNVPADPVEQQVISEILRIMKSPEILVHVDKFASENNEIERDELMKALQNLNDVWDYLYRAEQRKIVKMLIRDVEVHKNGIKLNLNLDGLNQMLISLS